jgi:hypothetical protein
MSKFNTKSKTSKTENYAGGEAFTETPELEYVSHILTSFVDDKYYRTGAEGITKLKEVMARIKDKKFLAQGAIYARTKFGMRSVSHVVAGEIAKNVKGEKWTKTFYNNVVYRPDDILEIIGYYIANYKKPLPNSLKKGLAKAISKFDAYQLSKYRGEGKSIKMVDAVNLVHPKHNDVIAKLMKGSLKSTETWEAKLTEAGKQAKDEEDKLTLKKEAWSTLIKERKIGYFALLRNLRNIIQQAPQVVDEACKMLVDAKLIKNSLVLPFRYVTAIKEIEELSQSEARKVLKALNTAVDISLNNVPKYPGKTLVVLDTSGSMEGRVGEIGALFSASLVKSNDCDFMMFSDDAKYLNLNTNDSILTIQKSIMSKFMSAGTNFQEIFNTANKAYDRVIILSDMQGWMNYNAPTKEYSQYCTKYKCKPFVFSFDLAGMGTLQLPQDKVYCLAGWSEKAFDIITLLEQDKQALINEIKKVEI